MLYTKYENSRPSSLREKKFEFCPLCPYVQTCDPGAGPVLTPGASYQQTCRDPQGDASNIKALDLPVSKKKNFEIVFLCSYVQTCNP